PLFCHLWRRLEPNSAVLGPFARQLVTAAAVGIDSDFSQCWVGIYRRKSWASKCRTGNDRCCHCFICALPGADSQGTFPMARNCGGSAWTSAVRVSFAALRTLLQTGGCKLEGKSL